MPQINLASANEIREAREDRQAHFKAPSRGNQMAFAMTDAAVKNLQHPVAEHVVSAIRKIK